VESDGEEEEQRWVGSTLQVKGEERAFLNVNVVALFRSFFRGDCYNSLMLR